MPFRNSALSALLALGLAGPAQAIDDRFDAAKYDNGGFAPVADATYAKECGSCHFTYLPGMLPARSWHAVLAHADDHFGESLSLAPDVATHLEQYLTENAADRSSYRGSQLMLTGLPASASPMRITSLPLMHHRHIVIRKLMSDGNTPVRKLTNCDSCHQGAASGSFAFDHIIVPGVSTSVRSGAGMF